MDETTRKELIVLLKNDTKKNNEPTRFALIANRLHGPIATWEAQIETISDELDLKPYLVKVYVDAIKLLLGELNDRTEHIGWVKNHAKYFIESSNSKLLSNELREWLQNIDSGLNTKENSSIQAALDMLGYIPDSSDQPGLYCFTYPSTMARNRFKIGMSEQGVKTRLIKEFSSKERTIQPEDPIVLRLWKSDNPKEDEKLFHKLLEREHVQSATGGHEWFDTSLNRIDLIAEALLLRQLKICQ